jgi:hypothetical protein
MYNPYNAIKVSIAAFCERAVYANGRWTLGGMFRWVEFSSFPAMLPPMSIYLLVTDAVGLDLWRIGCALVDSERMLEEETMPVLFAGRSPLNRGLVRGVYDARFLVPELEFKHPGQYDLHVDIDNEIVDLVSMHVLLRK